MRRILTRITTAPNKGIRITSFLMFSPNSGICSLAPATNPAVPIRAVEIEAAAAEPIFLENV